MKFARPFAIRKRRRQTRPRPARLRVESLEGRLVPSHVIEAEPPGTIGLNNTLATAEYLPGFGTGVGEDPAADIRGFIYSPPRTIAAAEDDGSIPLANPTGLVTEGTDFVVVTARIGDGPHGSDGTGSGDYDHYRFAARAGQLLTVDASAALFGSSLDTVIGLYDSSGTLLASNDDAFDHPVFGHTTDSLLHFLMPADDNYSLVVFGKGSGFQADPFDAASGGGAASEGDYQLTIALESPVRISQTEDDGALSLANETGLTAGAEGLVIATAVIGDGPDGSGGTGLGDFDLYRLEAAAGQLISVDTDTPVPFVGLDTIVGIYDSSAHLLAFNDDFFTSDSFIRFEAPATGTYFVLVAGVASEGDYSVTIGVANNEIDFYSFDLEAGDILGALLVDGADHVELYGPDGTLLVGSFFDDTFVHPDSSPLPGGGFSSISYVIDTPGRYAVAVSYGFAGYNLQLRAFRPTLEEQPVYSHQVLFLDFDGATLTPEDFPAHPDRYDLNNEVNPNATLSPLSSFLDDFGLTAADESAVIDAVVATVVENLAEDVSGVLGVGKNGDFQITGRAGEFQIEILNSRDHADPFGLYPNISRVIVGGTREEFGVQTVLAMAPGIDVGNFDTSETAVALLDLLSDPDYPRSLHSVPLGDGATMIDLIGVAVGNVVAHEAGHLFGNWHTDPFAPPFGIMTQFGVLANIGPDRTFGTEDDLDVDFERGFYSRLEDFVGVEDTLNTIAFGLSTGTKAGTYYDFVTGTLYVSGTIDDGHEDRLEARARGTNLEVFINGSLADTRSLASVQRVFFNGSGDDDKMDAAGLDLTVTMMGRGGIDKLTGGRGDDYLDGGDGDDKLAGGHGRDILLGGAGNDKLESGQGSDLLIGGRGGDQLDAGGDDDLLIAGFTNFDANPAALTAILAEWTAPREAEIRVANLRGEGSGPRLNGDYFLKTDGSDTTLFDDGDQDYAAGGSGRDWVIANLVGDGTKDRVTDLLSWEFADDLG
jgi:Bacterial pre-peptidase C-terminal domain/RTX calcium-binding nonapeptide repeat (4 copies)